MDQVVHGPCAASGVQVLNAFLNAVTVVLCAWLAQRRARADRERKNGHFTPAEVDVLIADAIQEHDRKRRISEEP